MSMDRQDSSNTMDRTVLVVDDNVANLRVISQCLQEDGCRVLTARDGNSALQRAQYGRPNLILLDVMMPDMDGFETCRRLKADNTLKSIPVIFMTALTGLEDKVKAFELGSVDYVTKPFQPEEVLARVRTHLHLRELTEHLEEKVHQRTEKLQQQITERKKIEEELKKHRNHLEELVEERTAELAIAKKQAEEANAAKSDFLARMSHDIRTPLNAVIGLTNIVLKSELTAEQRSLLNKITLAGSNLLQVINDILDFSKVEAGKLELEQAAFDLELVFEHLSDLFSERVSPKDIELIFTIDKETPRQVIGDPARLIQVLTNLIENAIKFTEKGEVVIKLSRGEVQQGSKEMHQLCFEVADTGVGIDEEVLVTLFDAFTQADGSLTREHQGTGLGLAICKQLVELMDGKIRVESTLGKGSCFSFDILVAAVGDDDVQLGLSEELQGFKTLVVDDSEAARSMLVESLASFGLDVVAADSGEDAIQRLHKSVSESPIQLVLIDWKMPGMDGLETARAIHEDPELKDPPIIILVTAYGVELIRKRLDTSIVDKLLLKPIKRSDLLKTILEVVSRKEGHIHEFTEESEILESLQLVSGRVLVVDDGELNLEVAVRLLQMQGLEVETAVNGKIAVEKVVTAHAGYYDAVFMDIQMPVMDGYEATRQIREHEKQNQDIQAQIPIIALTAHALKGEKEKCIEFGMNDYLSKPISENLLKQVLVNWIQPTGRELNQLEFDQIKELSEQNILTAPLHLDSGSAIKRLGGRKKTYLKLLQVFLSECSSMHNRFEQLIHNGERGECANFAHKVKGSAANIGADKLANIAGDLENSISDEGMSSASLFELFIDELKLVTRKIDNYLATESSSGGKHLDNVRPTSTEVLDTELFQTLLSTLLGYLEKGDMRALKSLEPIKKTLKGLTSEEQLILLEKQITTLDFENAALLLKTITEQ